MGDEAEAPPYDEGFEEDAPAQDPGVAPEEPPKTDPQPASDAPKESAADIHGTLHVAARSGSVDSIKMLLKNGADPMAVDAEGNTALAIAQEVGSEEVIRLLSEAYPKEASAKGSTKKEAKAEPETPKAKEEAPAAQEQEAKKSASVNKEDEKPEKQEKQSPLFGPSSPSAASQKSKDASPDTSRAIRADVERILCGFNENETASQMNEDGSVSRKKPPLAATVEGVVKGPTFMVAHSKWRTSPKWSMVPRGASLMRASSAPAPGTYDLPSTEKTKFKTGPRFGFGVGSRFGLDDVPVGKHTPGPAAYKPKDPSLVVGTKVGFGTSIRQGMGGTTSGLIPGPGAYEQKKLHWARNDVHSKGQERVHLLEAISFCAWTWSIHSFNSVCVQGGSKMRIWDVFS